MPRYSGGSFVQAPSRPSLTFVSYYSTIGQANSPLPNWPLHTDAAATATDKAQSCLKRRSHPVWRHGSCSLFHLCQNIGSREKQYVIHSIKKPPISLGMRMHTSRRQGALRWQISNYCSICLPRKPAAVSDIFTSIWLIFTLSSLLSITTVPIGSPPATIGATTKEEKASWLSFTIS